LDEDIINPSDAVTDLAMRHALFYTGFLIATFAEPKRIHPNPVNTMADKSKPTTAQRLKIIETGRSVLIPIVWLPQLSTAGWSAANYDARITSKGEGLTKWLFQYQRLQMDNSLY
jgi:hypothetical protein